MLLVVLWEEKKTWDAMSQFKLAEWFQWFINVLKHNWKKSMFTHLSRATAWENHSSQNDMERIVQQIRIHTQKTHLILYIGFVRKYNAGGEILQIALFFNSWFLYHFQVGHLVFFLIDTIMQTAEQHSSLFVYTFPATSPPKFWIPNHSFRFAPNVVKQSAFFK